MSSKSTRRATLVTAVFTALLALSCSSVLPWAKTPDSKPNEVNLSFFVRKNLLYVPSATIEQHSGRFFFGSAVPRTVFDPRFAHALGPAKERYMFRAGDRASVSIAPVVFDLAQAGDAILGPDALAWHVVTIDYHAGLLTDQFDGIHTAYMTMYRFDAEPAVTIAADGHEMTAVVDTASPDGLTLPSSPPGRGKVHVVIAGNDLGQVPVRYADVTRPRLGNLVLSKFLISIDYRNRVVGLWRDPRIR